MRADPGGFDLVVSDYNVPGMSGLDVARELSRIRPDLPVAVTSGYITDELRERAPQSGVRHLIYETDTVGELCEVVRRLTDERKNRGQSRFMIRVDRTEKTGSDPDLRSRKPDLTPIYAGSPAIQAGARPLAATNRPF